MKSTKKTIFVSLILLFVLGFSVSLRAETAESVKTKEINKSFSINKNSLLYVNNRFGNITISHWNKSEATIRVEIESVAASERDASENLERLKIDLRKEGDKVMAITSWENLRQSGQKNRRITVNYFISIPSTMKLELIQKYGNIILPTKNEGESTITVKYGNLKAGNFTKGLHLDAKYSNVAVRDVVNATLVLGYCGDVEVGNSKALLVDSKYSTMKIGNADKLDLEKKYGNLKTGTLKKVNMDVKYSDVTIDRLQEELMAESLNFGTVKIRNLDAGFKRIDVDSRYGTLDVRVSSKAAFRIEAEQIGKNLSIRGLKETKHQVEDKIDHFIEINGGGSAKIRFDGNRYSNLKLRANE